MGKRPEDCTIQGCHTAKLSARFGRKVRNLVDSKPFGKTFFLAWAFQATTRTRRLVHKPGW